MPFRLLCLAALSALTLLSPQDARAGFLGPSNAAAPTTSLEECSRAEEMTTCVLTGHLTRHERRNRYLFDAEGGRMIVDIPPHVFGQTDVRPEQTIRITGGKVFINDQELDESHYWSGTMFSDMSSVTVPEGHVFVMGDNRNASLDSRQEGPVPYYRIIGKAHFIIYPFDSFGSTQGF